MADQLVDVLANEPWLLTGRPVKQLWRPNGKLWAYKLYFQRGGLKPMQPFDKCAIIIFCANRRASFAAREIIESKKDPMDFDWREFKLTPGPQSRRSARAKRAGHTARSE